MNSYDLVQIKDKATGHILRWIRDFYRCPNMISTISKLSRHKEKAVILLGTPTFNNLGDHLIAVSEIQFLKECFPEKCIIEIPTQVFLRYRQELVGVVSEDMPIFITGGGWMGSLWPDDEYRMQSMITSFSGNRIVILPQTIYYDLKTEAGKTILASARRIYQVCRDLTICTRDNDSYQFARKHFTSSNAKVVLVPDIALYFNSSLEAAHKREIAICLRTDREKILKHDISEWVKGYAAHRGLNVKITDTLQNHSIPKWLRGMKIEAKIREFQRSKIVVTDRLHGMIFSIISNTNCIVFNNKTGKVAGVYDLWLRNNPRITYLAEDSQKQEFVEALESFLTFNDSLESWSKEIRDEFRRLMSIVRGGEIYETPKIGVRADPK